MLFLELLEIDVKTLVPWVENEDLEAERRGSDHEVGDGETATDDHGDVECSRWWKASKACRVLGQI